MIYTLPWADFFICFTVLFFGYLVFGMVGFGSALISSPVLAFFIPVSHIVPMLALMDLGAAVINVTRDGRKADFAELKWMVPLMIGGSLIGAAILLKTHPDLLAVFLGAFIVLYALYSLFIKKAVRHYPQKYIIPFGIGGGILSALFGAGGFVYAIYFAGRIEDKNRFRITQTTLIGFSTLTRVIIFLTMGIYRNNEIAITALLFLPAMVAGIVLGRHITMRIPKEAFFRFLNMVILLAGLTLLISNLVH